MPEERAHDAGRFRLRAHEAQRTFPQLIGPLDDVAARCAAFQVRSDVLGGGAVGRLGRSPKHAQFSVELVDEYSDLVTATYRMAVGGQEGRSRRTLQHAPPKLDEDIGCYGPIGAYEPQLRFRVDGGGQLVLEAGTGPLGYLYYSHRRLGRAGAVVRAHPALSAGEKLRPCHPRFGANAQKLVLNPIHHQRRIAQIAPHQRLLRLQPELAKKATNAHFRYRDFELGAIQFSNHRPNLDLLWRGMRRETTV